MTQIQRFLEKVIPYTAEVNWAAAYQADLPGIYNYFRYRIGNEQVAEDLTADTFEKAWKNRHQYRHDLAAFSTWLFTIAKNIAADYFRNNKIEVTLDCNFLPVNEEGLDNQVQQHSDYERLSKILSSLSGRDRELIALKYGAGLTNRTISLLSGLSETNVGTIIFRIKQNIRTVWEEDNG
jgi:RNA polymerase sigma-70 factor, ECF subfamily